MVTFEISKKAEQTRKHKAFLKNALCFLRQMYFAFFLLCDFSFVPLRQNEVFARQTVASEASMSETNRLARKA
jgi:hypothetical protein